MVLCAARFSIFAAMKRNFSLLAALLGILLASPLLSLAQSSLLQAGPMVGYVDMRQVNLWVQTTQAATVFAEYKQVGGTVVYRTPAVQTEVLHGFTAHLQCDSVQPGNTYTYTVFINKKPVVRPYKTEFTTPALWQWRTDPPTYRVVTGSCAYVNEERYDRPGKGYGSNYEIFNAIAQKQPNLMVWLGDNIYLREPDWGSRVGIYHRYTHGRSLPELQPLLAACPHVAVWDDHDFGPNDSDGSYAYKHLTTAAFRDFWANPACSQTQQEGIYTSMDFNDVQFFLLDNRSFRTASRRKTGERTILGKEQLEWLKNALVASPAKFKFVCIGGQFLNDVADFENHARVAPEERQEIIDFIVNEKIKNVIFLTGDRHHSELSLLEKDGIKIYDFTVSPFTSGVHDALSENNTLRVPGSHIAVHNFAVLEVSGPLKERKLVLYLYGTDGAELWKYEINAAK